MICHNAVKCNEKVLYQASLNSGTNKLSHCENFTLTHISFISYFIKQQYEHVTCLIYKDV